MKKIKLTFYISNSNAKLFYSDVWANSNQEMRNTV